MKMLLRIIGEIAVVSAFNECEGYRLDVARFTRSDHFQVIVNGPSVPVAYAAGTYYSFVSN